jgi:hypothetical protein
MVTDRRSFFWIVLGLVVFGLAGLLIGLVRA